MNRRTSLKPLVTLGLFVAISAIAILPLVGCKTPTADQCAQYKVAYEMYQASLLDRAPSKEEVAAARIAAAYLTASCGWVQTKAVDKYGVPVVKPPGGK